MKLAKIREVSKTYGISHYVLYSLIKVDPSFPVKNLGPVKNYRIHVERFEVWLHSRHVLRRSSGELGASVLSGSELIERWAP